MMVYLDIIDNASPGDIATWLARYLRGALAKRDGPVAINVPGGSTPFPIMEHLATAQLDWSRVVVWPGDDRVVPTHHPASNTGRIRAIFAPVGAEVAPLTVMEEVPHFALSWLGMGGDGHIASLFPNTDPQIDDPEQVRQLTPDPLPPEAPFERVTLTIPALLDSDAILFTLGGSLEKRAVFDAAVHREHDLPIARLLAAASQPVICFV